MIWCRRIFLLNLFFFYFCVLTYFRKFKSKDITLIAKGILPSIQRYTYDYKKSTSSGENIVQEINQDRLYKTTRLILKFCIKKTHDQGRAFLLNKYAIILSSQLKFTHPITKSYQRKLNPNSVCSKSRNLPIGFSYW